MSVAAEVKDGNTRSLKRFGQGETAREGSSKTSESILYLEQAILQESFNLPYFREGASYYNVSAEPPGREAFNSLSTLTLSPCIFHNLNLVHLL